LVGSPNWQEKYVGLLAFGAIMDGPDQEYLQSGFSQVYPIMVELIEDQNAKVRSAASYFLKRVIEH
jgi:hypothetical protein